MTVVLTADPLNLDSNSFVTVAEANAYFATRLNSGAWERLTDDDAKAKTLIWASKVLSRSYRWVGNRVNEHQYLEFPRYSLITYDGFTVDYDTYPVRIKEGTYELAMSLLENGTGAGSHFDAGLTDIKVGPIALKFSKDALLDGSGYDGNNIPDDITSIFREFIISSTGAGGGVFELVRT